MADKWIKSNGVLSFEGKKIKHGESIPKSMPKSRLEKLKAQGLVGDLKEFVPVGSEREAKLKYQIKKLKEVNKALEDKVQELEAESEESLKAEIAKLTEENQSLKKDPKK